MLLNAIFRPRKAPKINANCAAAFPFMRRMCTLCAQCCPSFNIGRTGENPCHELNGASPPARGIKRYLTQPKGIEAGAKMYTGSPSRPECARGNMPIGIDATANGYFARCGLRALTQPPAHMG